MFVFFSRRIVIKIWYEISAHTDFTSVSLLERALAGFNFTAYCDI